MNVVLNIYVVVAAFLWLSIGGIFAWKMAISPIAVFILILAWPLFLVLLVLAPIFNYFINRNLP